MSTPAATISRTVADLLSSGAHRSEVSQKHVTLALGGLYVASTNNAKSPPLLVWESEKGYPRYYLPTASLHKDIENQILETHPKGLQTSSTDSTGTSSGITITLEVVDAINSSNNNSKAIIERFTIGSKPLTLVRFLEGPFKDYVRFEKDEIGNYPLHRSF
jgi:hypothetical protein